MFTAGRGEGCRFVHVCRCMCGCCCVYQLSVSMVCMTPELADSHGSKVEAEPVWASWLKPTPAARTHTHKHMHWGGGMGCPPTRLISPLGLGSRQKYIDPKHTHAHTNTESLRHRICLVIKQDSVAVTQRDAAEMLSLGRPSNYLSALS